MATAKSAHGHCARGFHAVGVAFERNMEDGDTGAAFAPYQSGAIKVDARWQVRLVGKSGACSACAACSRDAAR